MWLGIWYTHQTKKWKPWNTQHKGRSYVIMELSIRTEASLGYTGTCSCNPVIRLPVKKAQRLVYNESINLWDTEKQLYCIKAKLNEPLSVKSYKFNCSYFWFEIKCVKIEWWFF
jgi:hypothetical protein